MSNVKLNGKVDTLNERLYHSDDALDILYNAQSAWMDLRPFRDSRDRCFRYYNGDQWSDKIEVEGKVMSERSYLSSIGQTPLQNNLINRLVRTVLGVYRSQLKEPTCVARDRDEQELGDIMSTVLQCNWQQNEMRELNARTMEEFLVSGMAVHRKSYGRRNGKCDCWTDYVNPSYFFFDSVMRDFRTWDVSLIGEIHDISFAELITTFAKTKADYDKLSEEYRMAKDSKYYGARYDRFFSRTNGVNDFLIPSDSSVCRVYEVWTLENKSRYHCHDYADGTVFKVDSEDLQEEVIKINNERIKLAREMGVPEAIIQQAIAAKEYADEFELLDEGMKMPIECALITATPFIDSYWYYRDITPTGMVLAEGETPFAHGGHPYVFRMYPGLNGEIHSFVEGSIDPQRYINRTITMINMIARASSKGVLMIPKSALGDKSEKDFAKQWSKPTGVIVYEDDHGRNPAPRQENSSMNTSALENMLNTQQKLLEDSSGVHGAAQGKPGASAVSGVLYAQQAQNSTMTLLDILDTFSGFEQQCALMDVQNIQQYYDDVRTINIAGRSSGKVVYDPRRIKNIVYDIAIGESTATPAYRQLAQDYYNQWLQAGMITIEQALEFGNFPNADALLQSIRTQKEQAAEQQQAASAPSPAPSRLEMPNDPTMEQPAIRPDNPLNKVNNEGR